MHSSTFVLLSVLFIALEAATAGCSNDRMLHPIVIRPAQHFWSFYCKQLDRRPLMSRCMTGFVGAIAGDLVAQSAERAVARSRIVRHKAVAVAIDAASSVPQYDPWRTFRLALWGLLVGTPLSYKWLQLLDGSVMVHNPRSPKAVVLKVLIDQLSMAPFGTMLFFFGMNFMEGHPERFVPAMQEKFIPTMSANYLVWPLAHTINFAFIPSSQRILYMNVVGVLWTAMLSHLVLADHGEGHAHEAPVELKLKV